MRYRPVIVVTGALCLLAAALGLIAGQRGMPSESDVINAGAALFIEETGGSAQDCIGLPGTGQVWISVVCGEDDGARTYLFDRRGTRLANTEDQKT